MPTFHPVRLEDVLAETARRLLDKQYDRIAAQLGFADRDALVAAHDADALSRLRREYWLACMERGTIPELRARRSPEWISANLERAVPPWYRSSTPLPRMCQGLGALTGTEAAAYEERWY